MAALRAFFVSPFSNSYAFFSLLESSSSLLCCALGACVAFRAGSFNLGGEGQASVGALCAALAASAQGSSLALPRQLGMTMVLVSGSLAGATLAWFSAVADRRSGAPIMLTSFLFGQAAIIIVNWALGGPLKEPGSNLLGMAAVPDSLHFSRLAPPSPLSAAFPLALCLALAFILFTRKTRPGIVQRLYGKNRDFARAVGFSPRIADASMIASGALAGLGGALLVLGQAGRAVRDMTGGVGWNGLAVALIAGTDGLGAVPVALFFAWLDSGARQASILADLSPDSSAVMKGVALFLITASLLGRDRPRSRRLGKETR
jgi:ABC-type uncharacterized transport system, permease component